MKLSDLKAGEHIVRLRNGLLYIVLADEDGLFLSGVNDGISLQENYNLSMVNKLSGGNDICEVYCVSRHILARTLEASCNKDPIWERGEVKANIDKAREVNSSNVVVNITNNSSNSDVQTAESTGPNDERVIDIVVSRKPISELQEKPSLHEEMEGLQDIISTLNNKLENINKSLKQFSDK